MTNRMGGLPYWEDGDEQWAKNTLWWDMFAKRPTWGIWYNPYSDPMSWHLTALERAGLVEYLYEHPAHPPHVTLTRDGRMAFRNQWRQEVEEGFDNMHTLDKSWRELHEWWGSKPVQLLAPKEIVRFELPQPISTTIALSIGLAADWIFHIAPDMTITAKMRPFTNLTDPSNMQLFQRVPVIVNQLHSWAIDAPIPLDARLYPVRM